MSEILSLSLRPKKLSEMVGQVKLVAAIRNHYESKREPRAWMFIGETGGGKTTLARILAMAVNCVHQERFGEPCDACYKRMTDFNISEINASEVSGVDDIGRIAQNSLYEPMPPSRRRVYILDEAHQLSGSSQNLLLKYFEDSPRTTVWIICTTDSHKIIRTLRSRCLTYVISPLGVKGTSRLLDKAVDHLGYKGDVTPLADVLSQQKITSPRLILMAMEKFIAGISPEEAVMGGESTVDTLRVCRAVANGDWERTKTEMKRATDVNTARMVRLSVAGYMRTIMLNSSGSKVSAAVEAIQLLADASRAEEGLQLSLTLAALYKITKRFAGR